MVVEGQSIRFCQQCGRFQLLEEFDGDRRSCRRKLEKHNERRRKLEGSLTDSDSGGEMNGRARTSGKYHRSGSPTQPWMPRRNGNPSMNAVDMLQNLAQDNYLMNALGPNLADGVRSLVSGGWPGSSASTEPQHPQSLPANLIAALTAGKAPSSLNFQPVPVLTSQPVPPSAVRPAVTAGTGIAPDSLQQLLQESNSGPPIKLEPQLGTAGSAFAPLSHAERIPPEVSMPQAENIRNGTNGRGPPSFSWGGTPGSSILPPAPAGPSAPTLSDMLAAMQQHNSNPPHVQPAAPAPIRSAPVVDSLSSGAFHPSLSSYAMSGALGGAESPAVGQLLSLLSQWDRKPTVQTPPDHDIMTLSLKLFKATPAQLPPGLLHELTAWMTKTPTYGEVAMRPGCVHTSNTVLTTAAERQSVQSDIRYAVQRMYGSSLLRDGGEMAEMALVQMHSNKGTQAAVVLDGRVKMILDMEGDAPGTVAVPTPVAVRPLAVTPSHTDSFSIISQTVTDPEHDRVFCRSHGDNAQLEVLGRGLVAGGKDGGYVRVGLPGLVEGSYVFEFARGPLVSSPVAVLVLNNEAAVKEVRQLESDPFGVADVPAFVQKLGLVARMSACVAAECTWNHQFPGDVIARFGQLTSEVAAVCLLRGWPALLECALPVLDAIMPADEVVKSVEDLMAGGLSVLEAAVVSGNPRLVEVVCKWAQEQGVVLISDALNTESGLSAFHLVAMLREPCPVAAVLQAWVPRAAECWSKVTQGAEVSSLSVASALMQRDLLRMLASEGVPLAAEMLVRMHKGQGAASKDGSELSDVLALLSDSSSSSGDDQPSSSSCCVCDKNKMGIASVADANHQVSLPPNSLHSSNLLNQRSAAAPSPHLRSLLVFYHLVVAVLLPALLPENMAVGAALLPAVVTAASCGSDSALEITFAMVQATIMAVLSVGLNKSSVMGYARAGATAAMCNNSSVRAVLGLMWVAVIACHLPLTVAQQSILFVTNIAALLFPAPAASTCRDAWVRMIGAAGACMMLALVVPLATCKLLWLAGYPVRRGRRANGLGERTYKLGTAAQSCLQV